MQENTCSEKQNGCSGDCEHCSGHDAPESLLEPLNPYSHIKKVIGIVSGKGGVGKSLVTAMNAVMMAKKGYRVGILDADITGPSIPKMFGINGRAYQNEMGLLPAETAGGIKVMSVNLLLEDAESPVVWRGPVIAGAVKQFWTEVVWGDLDYLFIDMPPGTGDVPLTVFQSIPVNGIEIVTSPQDLVALIVKKAYNMAKLMDIPVLGLVENMSYLKCPDCGREIRIFGHKDSADISKELGLPLLGKIPLDPAIAALVDSGRFYEFDGDYLTEAQKAMEKL